MSADPDLRLRVDCCAASRQLRRDAAGFLRGNGKVPVWRPQTAIARGRLKTCIPNINLLLVDGQDQTFNIPAALGNMRENRTRRGV